MVLTFGVAVLAAACLQLGRAAEQDTFSRPNANECASPQSPVNFLEYGSALGDVVECSGPVCDYKEQAGLFFDLTYRQNYKVVKYNQIDVDVTYILYQCGTGKPDDAFTQGLNASTTAYVEIPVTAVATGDSTAAWMLEELGVEDRVRFAAEFATSPCMIKLASPQADGGCNRPFLMDQTTFMPIANLTDYDVEFAFGTADSTAAKQVAFRVSADPGPLRRVEHIVYMAAFFNLEAKAIEFYAQVEAEYEKLVAPAGPNAPVMAWVDHTLENSFYTNADGDLLEGQVYRISFAAYKVALTGDSGAASLNQAALGTAPAFALGDDIYFAESEFPSLEAAQTAVKDVLKGVDILIDESFSFGNNLTTFLTNWGITGAEQNQMPFLANEQLFSHDKDQTTAGADDWFGEAIARPDLVLLDMRSIVAPAQFSNHTTIFFRNLALNEPTTISGLKDCTDLKCNAYNNQQPLLIGAEAGAPAPAAAPATPVPAVAGAVPAAVPAAAEAEGEVEGEQAAMPAEAAAAGAVSAPDSSSAGVSGVSVVAFFAAVAGVGMLW